MKNKNHFKKIILALLILISFTNFLNAQTKKPTSTTKKKVIAKPSTTTQSKSSVYTSVTIGNQEWMSKNLDVTTFSNGDPIPQAQTTLAWVKAATEKKPAWCYYELGTDDAKHFGNARQCKIYGKLYNSYAIFDPRGLAPKGWQIANENDWKILLQFAEDNIVVNHDIDLSYSRERSLSSKQGWYDKFNLYPVLQGLDLFGINIPPAGFRDERGYFEDIGEEAKLIVYGSKHKYDYNSDSVFTLNITDSSCEISYVYHDLGLGLSVRCVKEKQKEYIGSVEYYIDNGVAKHNSKDYNGAIGDYTNAIKMDPKLFAPYYYRGVSKFSLDDWIGAGSDFETARFIVESQDVINEADLNIILFSKGMVALKLKQFDACYFFNEALKYGNKDAQIYIDKNCKE